MNNVPGTERSSVERVCRLGTRASRLITKIKVRDDRCVPTGVDMVLSCTRARPVITERLPIPQKSVGVAPRADDQDP